MSAAPFIMNASSLLLRTLRGSFLIILVSFYFLSASQTTIISPLASAKKITVTHSHSHADDHEDDHHEHEDHDPKDSHKESSTHSHTIIVVGSPAAYTSPENFPFVGIILSNPAFILSHKVTPPLDPGLGSIFRPPIA